MKNNELAESLVILSDNVIFNPLKRTLSQAGTTVTLSENETCLLKMLLTKTCSKREVMHEIWEKRGVIVTESSYYKLVRQLRTSFKHASLDASLITTLPRIGILYSGSKEITTLDSVQNKKKGIISKLIQELSGRTLIVVSLGILALSLYSYMFKE